MKFHLPTLTAFGLSFCSAQAQVTVGLDFASDQDDIGATGVNLSNSEIFSTNNNSTTSIGTVQNDAATNDMTVTIDDGAFSGVYEISVTVENVAVNGATAVGIARGGSGTLGTAAGNSLTDADQTLVFDNVVLTFVSGDNVFRFDGFTGVRIGNLSGTEVATITDGNGTELISIADGDPGEGGGNDFGPTAPFALSSTVIYSGVGTSLNVLDAQFSLLPPEPSPTLSTAATSPLTGDFTVDVVFNEDVTGLDASDFMVTNGMASNVLPATGPASVYTVTISPFASGDVEVELPAASAQDVDSLDSLVSNTLSRQAILEPMVTLSTTASEPVAGAYIIDVVFNEDVTGLDASDFVVTNGTASNVLPAAGPASVYTVAITPATSGDVVVELPAAAAQNLNTLSSLASSALTTFAVLPGSEQATITLSTTASDPVIGGTYVIDILFSEDITDLDAGDFTVVNGVVTDITPVTGPASVYTVTIDPTATGSVEVTLLGGGVTDVDDLLPSLDSNILITNYINPTLPEAIFVNGDFVDDLVTSDSFTLFLDFTEDVSGLELSDFLVTNGTVSNLAAVSAFQYDIDITPTGTGTIIVELLPDSVTDLDAAAQGDLSFGNPQAFYIAHNLAADVFATGAIDLAGRDTTGLGAGESGGFFLSPKTFDSISDGSLNDIPWNDGVNSGTFDLSFVANGTLEFITRTGRGGFGTSLAGGVGLIGPDQSVTLGSFVASNVTGAPIGQTITNIEVLAVFFGNFGGIDSTTINGFDATGTGTGAFQELQRNTIPATQFVDVTGIAGGGGSINGIQVSYQVGEPPLNLEIVACGFEGDNFFIELAGGTSGLVVTSSDTLNFASPSSVNAIVDPGNSNRFLIPSSERTATRDFFRVEEAP